VGARSPFSISFTRLAGLAGSFRVGDKDLGCHQTRRLRIGTKFLFRRPGCIENKGDFLARSSLVFSRHFDKGGLHSCGRV
jgi:hypothetical protein